MAVPAPTAPGRPASLALRVMAMVYEGVLLFGVTFAAGLAVLTLSGWTAPLSGARRLVLQVALFVVVGAYFVWCWSRSGQTLALKTWKLRVIDLDGRSPSLARAIGRYLLSWTLFLPGLAFIAMVEPARTGSLIALALGFAVMLIPAIVDPQRRLLHDRWTRTRIVRDS
jgi:uncharacterized RDD family membrane protein YckC